MDTTGKQYSRILINIVKEKLTTAYILVLKCLEKRYKPKQLLKLFGIVLGVFIIDSAILGALANGIIKHIAVNFRGQDPSELIHSTWYIIHPFKTAWIFFRHILGSPINIVPVFNVWVTLNVICIMAIAGKISYKKYEKVKTKHGKKENQERDIRKIIFKNIEFDALERLERTPAEQVFLGLDDQRQPVQVEWSKMTEHIHILGGSGTGKTSLAVMPICAQAIRRGLPVIVIDFKGDKQAIQVLYRETKKADKRFFLFSLHPEVRSNTYNPIHSGDAMSKVERVMTALELVYDGPAKFYTYSQQAIFLPLLKHFDRQDMKYTMRDVRALIRDPELVQEILGEEINPGHVKGMAAALASYADTRQINAHETDIDLARIMEAGDVVYFDLRSAVAPQMAAGLGKMIALDLQSQAAFRNQNDRIALIAIDEFQNMACQAFRNIISKVRSANYSLVLANQALGDLRAVGEDFLNITFTNTRTKIVFGVEHPDDAELFAKKSGQVIFSAESQSHSESKGAGQMFARSVTVSEGKHENDKNMIHQNVFLRLPFLKSVIFRRGQLAALCNHAHMISEDEKNNLEAAPYPEPEYERKKKDVRTVSEEIERMKMILIERKKQNKEKQSQNQPQGQPQEHPGQGDVATIETEDIVM